MTLPKGYTERDGKIYNSAGNWVEKVDGKWLEVKGGLEIRLRLVLKRAGEAARCRKRQVKETMPELRYVVRGRVAKTIEAQRIYAGEQVWLSYSREAGGWYDWTRDAARAWPFTDRDKATAESGSNGPWYLVPDPASIEVLEADYTPPQVASLHIRSDGQSAPE